MMSDAMLADTLCIILTDGQILDIVGDRLPCPAIGVEIRLVTDGAPDSWSTVDSFYGMIGGQWVESHKFRLRQCDA